VLTCVLRRVVSCPVVLCPVSRGSCNGRSHPKESHVKCLKRFACSEVIMNSGRKRSPIVQKERSPFASNSHGWPQTKTAITTFVTVDGVSFCLINSYISHTALQAERSHVRFRMVAPKFFIDILPAALWPWGRLSL
jgi:hypothetical protein